jgi:hypothetical protein
MRHDPAMTEPLPAIVQHDIGQTPMRARRNSYEKFLLCLIHTTLTTAYLDHVWYAKTE